MSGIDKNETAGAGRASYTNEERRELVEEFKTSGLMQAAFCREWNLNSKTLARWLRIEQKVQCLMKKLFGRSLEKLSPGQLMLELEELRELQEALE